jgi:PAS domain S-box-containing protein
MALMFEDVSAVVANPARLAAVRRVALLDSPPAEAFDRLTRLAAKLLRVPVALLTLVDYQRQFIVSSVGLPEPWASRRETSLNYSYCQYTIALVMPVVIEDARQHARLRDSQAVTDLNAIAYAGIPLFSPDGQAIGAFSAIDHSPRIWTAAEIDILKDLTASVTAEINLRLARSDVGQARQALLAFEKRFQLMAHAVRDAVYDINLNTGEAWWGRNIAMQFGYPTDQVQNTQAWWRAHIHPDDREKVADSLNKALESASDFWSKEYRFLRGDGSYAHVFDRGYFQRDGAGQANRLVGAVADITQDRNADAALYESELRFRQVIETSQQGIWFIDIDRRTTFVNERMAHMLGYTVTEMRGASIYEYMDDESRAVVDYHLERRRQGLKDEYDLRFKRKDGTDLWVMISAGPIYNLQQKYVGAYALLTDITERKRTESELQAQKELFENLVAVARATAERPSLEATLQNTLNISVSLTGALRGSLFLFNPAGEVTHSLLSPLSTQLPTAQALVDLVMRKGLAGWVARHREAVLIGETLADERWVGPPDKEYGTHSVLAVPIQHSSDLLGILTLLHPRPHHFKPSHLSLMQAAADQMALALRNARMFDDLQRQAEEMYMLNHITRAAIEANDLSDVVQALADWMGELIGADGCFITLWDGERHKTIPVAASGEFRDTYVNLPTQPDELTMTGSVMAAERALVAEDIFDSPYLSPNIAEQFSLKSLIGVPLIARNRKLGAALISFKEVHHFTQEEIELTERAGRQVALALSNAILYKDMVEERGRLRALIESSRDGVVLVGMDQRLLACNGNFLHYTNLRGTPDDWVGRNAVATLKHIYAFAPDLVKLTLGELRRIQSGNEPPSEGDLRIGSRWVHWINLPVLTNSTPIGRLIVLRDVTDQQALEEMRTDLTHMIVHDLRSPLSAIIGSIDLLAAGAGNYPEGDRQVIDLIQEGAERMMALVNDILDVSQLETNHLPLIRGPVAVRPLLTEVLQLQNGALVRKQINLVDDLQPDLPVVWADPILLGRVLQNLLSNAVKFTPPQGVIRVMATETASQIEIAIHNSGPGVPAEIKPMLFQKFVRGQQHEHGSGLGLAFCRLAIEAHGGRIWVESEPGEGATFRFTLPRHV